MRIARIIVWVGLLGIAAPVSSPASENGVLSAIQVTGAVWRWESRSSQWQPLTEGDAVVVGDRVKSEIKSSVEFAADAERRVLMRLAENSALTYLSAAPRRFALDRGVFYVRHEASGDISSIRILTARFLVELENGGVSIHSVSGEPAQVKVYSEEAKVYPKKGATYLSSPERVEEGTKWTDGEPVSRMMFQDYTLWSEWYKRSDEQKDKLRFYT